jgi:hypothetical protein
MRDFLRRQAADRPQRQRNLRVWRERGMTAREDEAEAIVFEPFAVGIVERRRRCRLEPPRQLRE